MNKIADENKENIRNTIAMLPDVTKNINTAATGINENLDKVVSVVGSLDGAIVDTMSAFSGGMENLLNFLSIASAAFNAIVKMFYSGKKTGLLKGKRG
jgi:ABC-type transporter Mla subunit MlaD